MLHFAFAEINIDKKNLLIKHPDVTAFTRDCAFALISARRSTAALSHGAMTFSSLWEMKIME